MESKIELCQQREVGRRIQIAAAEQVFGAVRAFFCQVDIPAIFGDGIVNAALELPHDAAQQALPAGLSLRRSGYH